MNIKKKLKKIKIIVILYKLFLSIYHNLKKIVDLCGYKIYLNKLNKINREEYLNIIKEAILNNKALAIAKLGTTEQQIISYRVYLYDNKKIKIHLNLENLFSSFTKNAGVFPSNHNFILEYGDYFIKNLLNIDVLGYFKITDQVKLLNYFKFNNKVIFFIDQEPDRSIPDNDSNCYLPFFKDKKILIICPFGNFLASRANKDTFEKVWQKTGKKWFYPKSVEGLEFPYGLSKSTQEKYQNVFNLLEEIQNEIKKRDFDIALIGAGGIAIPLASYIKNLGKIAISLGGHLQVLFGVLGGRWRNNKKWKKNYINEFWVNLPEKYIPKESSECENSCYW